MAWTAFGKDFFKYMMTLFFNRTLWRSTSLAKLNVSYFATLVGFRKNYKPYLGTKPDPHLLKMS